MADLWGSDDGRLWRRALDAYGEVVDRQGVEKLPALDRWYREELPAAIVGRTPPAVTHEELVKLTEWKMARGVWRARNLVLVRGNDPALVASTSAEALAEIPHSTRPISILARLAGVGPATASAVASAAAPAIYPFFDELVAAQIPGLGPVAFTMSYYGKYAAELRRRASALGAGWTPTMAERALWSNSGGKAGLAAGV